MAELEFRRVFKPKEKFSAAIHFILPKRFHYVENSLGKGLRTVQSGHWCQLMRSSAVRSVWSEFSRCLQMNFELVGLLRAQPHQSSAFAGTT